MIHAVRFVCIQKCHLRAALDIQFIRMTRLDIASNARAESHSTETPQTPLAQRIPGAHGVGRAGTKKVQKVLGCGTHDDGQQERWDQIKRGRKLSSSIMSSANLKGESDRPSAVRSPVLRTAPHKKGNRTKDHCEEEEDFSGCSKEPFRLAPLSSLSLMLPSFQRAGAK